MVSTCGSKDSGRPRACTAMLYSLISSTAPSKYLSQTNVRSRTGLFVRPNTPEDRTASTSARSVSSLLIAGCKWIPRQDSAFGTPLHLRGEYNRIFAARHWGDNTCDFTNLRRRRNDQGFLLSIEISVAPSL